MTQQERAQLIRDRAKARGIVFRYQPGKRYGREPVRRWAYERKRGTAFHLVNRGNSCDSQQPQWIRQREKPKHLLTPRTKRARQESPFMVIARKLLVKPKREV